MRVKLLKPEGELEITLGGLMIYYTGEKKIQHSLGISLLETLEIPKFLSNAETDTKPFVGGIIYKHSPRKGEITIRANHKKNFVVHYALFRNAIQEWIRVSRRNVFGFLTIATLALSFGLSSDDLVEVTGPIACTYLAVVALLVSGFLFNLKGNQT